MGHVAIPDIFSERRRLEELAPRLIKYGLFAALIGIGATILLLFIEDGEMVEKKFFHSYLVSLMWALSIALGGLFVTMIHHAARVGWSTVVRRLAEGIAMNVLPLALVFGLFLALGMDQVYDRWLHPSGPHAHHIELKHAWLNSGGFWLRMVVYFGLWGGLAFFFFKNSVSQDESGDEQVSRRMQKISAPGLIIFALSITFAAFDLLMSLNPTWYSTIFGVYYFAGSAGAIFAFLAICCWYLQKNDRLTRAITVEHYHDLGKFMFAFLVFWAYIGFSQYMLIWYADIPEETQWFRPHHDSNSWAAASIVLMLGHFFIPFVGFMSRNVKRRKGLLCFWAIWMLCIHWFDQFWVVMPRLFPEAPPGFLMPVMSFLGVAGLFVAMTAYNLRNCSLIPERDPRLRESLAFENV